MAESIDSDIDNLSSILTMWDMVPQGKSQPAILWYLEISFKNVLVMLFLCILILGLFLDSAISVARKELTWETDYQREAQCSMIFK